MFIFNMSYFKFDCIRWYRKCKESVCSWRTLPIANGGILFQATRAHPIGFSRRNLCKFRDIRCHHFINVSYWCLTAAIFPSFCPSAQIKSTEFRRYQLWRTFYIHPTGTTLWLSRQHTLANTILSPVTRMAPNKQSITYHLCLFHNYKE